MPRTSDRATPRQGHRSRERTGQRLVIQVLVHGHERVALEQFLGYFTTDRSSNGGTEAINGIIELHRLLARGYRNRHNYRLRMLLVAGGLLLPPELR